MKVCVVNDVILYYVYSLFLLHDNASAHTAATTVDIFNESEAQLLPHPPYSPDLSPWDFLLLPEMKKQLKNTQFEGVEDAYRAFTRAVEDIQKLAWAEEWNMWFHSMAKCRVAERRFLDVIE